MNKKLLALLLTGISLSLPAQAFDFSSIDPRMGSARAEAESASEEAAPARQSSVFRTSQPAPAAKKKAQPAPIPLRSSSVKIVAVVNGDIISTEDIDNRIKAFVMTSQIPMNDETKGMIYQKVLTSTIDEKLKVQEADKNNIKISDKEVDNAIAGFAETNKIPRNKISSVLRKYGISDKAFREQMKSDLAWLRLIRQKSSAGNPVTQKDIDREMETAKADFATPKFFISEILIKKERAQNLSQLTEILNKDPRFEMYAFRFSESPTAANGGKLGWINKESLPEPLAKTVAKMKVGQISEPIQVGEDYYIIKLDQAFDPSKDKVAMPTNDDIRRYLENKRTDAFATQYIQSLRQRAVIEFRS